MNSIEYINSLSPEQKLEAQKAAQRAIVKHILTFVALKAVLFFGIAYAAKKARDLA